MVYMYRPDRETEERAQRAIEQFFANNLIAPSPWSDPKKKKKKPILPATPANQGEIIWPGTQGLHFSKFSTDTFNVLF